MSNNTLALAGAAATTAGGGGAPPEKAQDHMEDSSTEFAIVEFVPEGVRMANAQCLSSNSHYALVAPIVSPGAPDALSEFIYKLKEPIPADKKSTLKKLASFVDQERKILSEVLEIVRGDICTVAGAASSAIYHNFVNQRTLDSGFSNMSKHMETLGSKRMVEENTKATNSNMTEITKLRGEMSVRPRESMRSPPVRPRKRTVTSGLKQAGWMTSFRSREGEAAAGTMQVAAGAPDTRVEKPKAGERRKRNWQDFANVMASRGQS